MKRVSALLCGSLFAGCLSDLSVGMSFAPVQDDDDDGGVPFENDVDGGAQPELDASVDASPDAPSDGGHRFEVCPTSNCLIGFISPTGCDDGGELTCARMDDEESCFWYCL